MIEHLVLLKVKPDASVEEAEKMMKGLKSLPRLIPVIRELSCGKNTGDRNQGFTHGLLVRFKSAADLETYVDHPEHKRIVDECLTPVIEDVIVVDYEA